MKIPPPRESFPAQLVLCVRRLIVNNRLVLPGEHVIVAVSGGSDSLALLDILRKIDYRLELTAVYLDHGLRPQEVPGEIDMLQNFCKQSGITFLCRSIDAEKQAAEQGSSLEEAGRILRYRELQDICLTRRAKAIATGHTADDQVEEFFIRLVRGGSLSSLGGMDLKRGNIIRPLLHQTKEKLVRYLKESGICWCTDSSNEDRKFLRNRIRLDILPLLEKSLNPSIRRTILQSMDILKIEDSYLNAGAAAAFADTVRTKNDQSVSLDGPGLLAHHPALQRRVVERCFWLMQIKPNYLKINAILDLLVQSKDNSELHLEKHVRVKKKDGGLLFYRSADKEHEKSKERHLIKIEIPGPGRYICRESGKVLEITVESAGMREKVVAGGSLYADAAVVAFPLLLRSVLPGDRFHPCNSPGSKKVNRFFTDKKIPVDKRQDYPVLTMGGCIVALLGLQVDDRYRITESTGEILRISWEPLEPGDTGAQNLPSSEFSLRSK